MHRVAILTPNPAEADNATLWPKVLARLQSALDGAGIETVPTPWTAHVSHAVNKRPVPGEFRIQEEFGGRYSPASPPAEAMTLAEQVLAAVQDPLLYARIDMVPDADGRWLLMEAELIEPDFWRGPSAGRELRGGFAQSARMN